MWEGGTAFHICTGFCPCRLLFIPGLSLFYVGDLVAHTLVVVGIEPEHTRKYLLCFPKAAEAPHAETVAVQAPEEGSILDEPLGKEAAEVLPEGELSDLYSHVVVADGRVRIVIERQVPEVGVGVEAAEIGGKEVHERAVRLLVVTRLFQIHGLYDGVRVGIVQVPAGEDKLHLIHGSPAFPDDGPRPRLYRLIRLSPIVVFGVPHSFFFQGEGCETETRYIRAPGGDLPRYVRVAGVLPYLVRYHGDDLARHSLEEAGGSERKGTVRADDATGDGVSFDGKGDEIGLLPHDDIILRCLRPLVDRDGLIGVTGAKKRRNR